MGKGFSIESLNDVESLKGKIGLELMWGIHGRADAELRKSLPNQKDSSKDEEHIELSESEKMFNRKLLQLAEASDNTKQFRHLLDEIPRIDDELNGSEVEFRSFAENRVREVYSEDVKDNYDEETLERLNEISDFSWSDLERSLTNCSDLEPETTHYVNLVNSWTENLRPDQVAGLLSDEYAGLVYNQEGFRNSLRVEGLENAIEALAENNFDEDYREVLEDVEQLGFDEGAEYLEELQSLQDLPIKKPFLSTSKMY